MQKADSLEDIVQPAIDSTGLKIVINNNPIWDIVSIYGDSDSDFTKMKEAFILISKGIDSALTDDELTTIFDEYIGEEGGEKGSGLIENFIFSATNEYESWYRVDIYTKAFLE